MALWKRGKLQSPCNKAHVDVINVAVWHVNIRYTAMTTELEQYIRSNID